MSLDTFHPTVRRWFEARFGAPSPPQREGWPHIVAGRHTLIAAPTGTGKTLAAFLSAIDSLLRQGSVLPDTTQVVYVSPLKALGNDVQKNLQLPLDEMRAADPSLPEVRVMVRTGDTRPADRAKMRRRPPHILVTTPETLYILLTSDGGRTMLQTARTVIIDEIHAVSGDKRGSHLALSLERLEALCPQPPQRIGLSATQKPIEQVARLLVGVRRECATVDIGHQRAIDLGIEIPDSPLETVCSNETWQEIYARMAALILEHRTTLVFVNTRKLAERVAARLTEKLGAGAVTSHHGSLARHLRLEAERRLKAGELKALVATASLELGIDVGEVDLVIQTGVTPSIAALIQRVGRAGHALARTPKGRIFPLTQDELAAATALLDAVRRGELDRTPQPAGPLDILAQQIVAACVPETWDEEELFSRLTKAWPYRDLPRSDFDAVVSLHTQGRSALLHRDGVRGRLRATRRARLTAITSGGAIPDTADYRVLLSPEDTPVGTVHEDFAVEASAGDIFQLGNASWQILKVESGVVRVADAQGAPPTLPFWIGEGPARTREMSAALARVRDYGRDIAWLTTTLSMPEGAARQMAEYAKAGALALGAVPSPECFVAERFFDESGGMQMVLHTPLGGRINRAWGLALRKKICRGFGFELQAAISEEAILISLGPMHSFPLEEVFTWLAPESVKQVLVQAVLASPMFATRWRWNVTRSLMLSRTRGGGTRVPAPLLRMRADDLLAACFPEAMACGETLPPGDLPIPWEHPIVRQTLEDCLHEAMDLDGLTEALIAIRDGSIRTLAIDTPEPSPYARGVLHAMPYAFLDDAPLEERRAQAVMRRRGLDPKVADTLGALDPAAVSRVREEAWPQPEDVEELHEALLWMGYATVPEVEACGWRDWVETLRGQGRVAVDQGRWIAAEATREPKEMLRGRLEALGPVVISEGIDEVDLLALEREGVVLRCRLEGRAAWCERRLLARIHRYTLDRLREAIRPASAAAFWRFLCCWQHLCEEHRLEGPRGVALAARQLAGFEAPAGMWERGLLAARVRGYRPDWLDAVTLSGEIVWGRLWGAGASALRSTPVSLLPREDLPEWLAMATPPGDVAIAALSSHARTTLAALRSRGAIFTQELERATGLLPSHLEMGLGELIGHGLVTCDAFAGLRRLLQPPHKRARSERANRAGWSPTAAGRWSLLARGSGDASAERAATTLLSRYGVVFKRLLDRERIPIPWRDIVRVLRRMELEGRARGGRFVAGFAGEQFAHVEAVERLRRSTTSESQPLPEVAAGDPLNLAGILTPADRIPTQTRRRVKVG